MLELFRPSARMPRNERVTGGSIYLRPPREEDWTAWSRLREISRDFLVPWEPTWPPDCLTRAAFQRRLRHYAGEWQSGTGYAFFIFSRTGDELRGGITLSNVRRGVAQTGTLGYWVGAPFARRGIMTESLYAMMEFAFERLRLHRLEAACLPRNRPSRAALCKVGFREEGFAEKFLRINGVWEDHVLFGLLDEEARRSKAAREWIVDRDQDQDQDQDQGRNGGMRADTKKCDRAG